MKPAAMAILAAVVTIGAAGLGALAWGALRKDQGPGLLAWQDPVVVARGAALYASECTACHGGLAGAPAAADAPAPVAPPHDETGHSWEHADYILFGLTKTGEVAELCLTGGPDGAEMPEFAAQLSDRQILDVLSFIKSTWPEETRARQEATNAIYAAQNAATRAVLEGEGL